MIEVRLSFKKTYYYENSPINQQNSLISQDDNQKKIKIQSYKLSEILKMQNNRNAKKD